MLELGTKCMMGSRIFTVARIHRATLVEGNWRKKGKMKLRSSQM
jgi:hypothetical protein